jgi:hypothetical protein
MGVLFISRLRVESDKIPWNYFLQLLTFHPQLFPFQPFSSLICSLGITCELCISQNLGNLFLEHRNQQGISGALIYF